MNVKVFKKFNLKNSKKFVKSLATPGKGLREKTVKGGIWVFSLRIINRLFQLVRTIVLARLLSPNDFGLFGIALLALSALETFSQTGFRQALIQKKEEIKPYLNTAWTVGIIRGLLIAVILFFVAPLVAIFFETPTAIPILRVIGIAIILQSLINIAVIYFEKELKFHKYFVYQFLGTITDVTVAISAAFLLRSVWALVFGLLAGNLVRCIVSYIIDSYRPRFQFNKSQVKELFGFGKWILGSSMLVFLVTQGDDIFVGKLLGVTMLGFYQMAYRISNLPATEITHVISQVTFPAYSKLQDNIPKLREAYLKVLQVTAFLSFPIAGLIFVLAPDFTKIFLGVKWMPMVPAMQVLVFAGLIRSIGATTGPIFQAVGKPKIITKWQMIRLFVLAIFIYPLTVQWGILGVLVAVFLSTLVSTIGFNYMAIKIMECRIKSFGKVIVLPLINGIIMVFVIFVLKDTIPIGIMEFFLLIGIATFVFFALTYLFDKFMNYGMYSLIREALIPLRKR